MSVTPRSVSGLELLARTSEAHDAILTPDALDFVGSLVRDFGVAARRAARAPPRAPAPVRRRRAPRLPARHAQACASRRGRSRRVAAGPARSPRGDHRPGRSQDGHQRAQLGRERVHGRLRGLQLAHVGQRRARPPAPVRRRRGHDRVHGPRDGEALPARPEAGDADGAAARLAPAREARRARRPARPGVALRLRPLPVPQRAGADGAGHAGRTSTCRSWSPTSRRGCGTTCSWRPSSGSGSRPARSGRRC